MPDTALPPSRDPDHLRPPQVRRGTCTASISISDRTNSSKTGRERRHEHGYTKVTPRRVRRFSEKARKLLIDLAKIVEAGSGIEPLYTDLQSKQAEFPVILELYMRPRFQWHTGKIRALRDHRQARRFHARLHQIYTGTACPEIHAALPIAKRAATQNPARTSRAGLYPRRNGLAEGACSARSRTATFYRQARCLSLKAPPKQSPVVACLSIRPAPEPFDVRIDRRGDMGLTIAEHSRLSVGSSGTSRRYSAIAAPTAIGAMSVSESGLGPSRSFLV